MKNEPKLKLIEAEDIKIDGDIIKLSDGIILIQNKENTELLDLYTLELDD